MLKDDYKKEEKINGVIFNMSPSPHFRHGIVNGNIYGKIKEGLKGSYVLYSWKIRIININQI